MIMMEAWNGIIENVSRWRLSVVKYNNNNNNNTINKEEKEEEEEKGDGCYASNEWREARKDSVNNEKMEDAIFETYFWG